MGVPADRKGKRALAAGHAGARAAAHATPAEPRTLARQLLLGRQPLGVVDAVRRIVAVQAQEAASPYIALWNRVAGFDPGDLDAAFADHSVVKATLMRITLHAVAADDHPDLHQAMQESLRAARLNDARFRRTGLTAADADAVVPDLLAFAAERRTNAASSTPGSRPASGRSRSRGRGGRCGRWRRSCTPRREVPGPSGRARRTSRPRPAVHRTTASSRCSDSCGVTSRGSGRRPREGHRLVRVALHADGPGRARRLGDRLEHLEGPGGTELYDVPDGDRPDGDTVAPPRLMAMWDSTLLAYADRTRIVPAAYRQLVTRRNGDVLPTLLVDGYVCGVWRPVDDGIEATAFHELPDDALDGLARRSR